MFDGFFSLARAQALIGQAITLSQDGSLLGLDQPRLPTLIATAGERASVRFLEFFASTLRNPHTRRAYARAVADFLPGARTTPCPRSPPCSRCT